MHTYTHRRAHMHACMHTCMYAYMHAQVRVIDLFRDWDADSSGQVDRKEFARVLPALGLEVSEAEGRQLFDMFDPDRSGTIELNEFLASVSPSRRTRRLAQLAQAAPETGTGM